MKIVQCDNIFDDNVNRYLIDKARCSLNFLYISATNNIFKERKKSVLLNEVFQNRQKTFVSEGFESYISRIIRKKKGYLPLVDMYYILKRLIDNYFKNDDILKSNYQNLYYKIFELYKFLIFHDTDYIAKDPLEQIKKEYPHHVFLLFDLYNQFQRILQDLIKSIQTDSNSTNHVIPELNITFSLEINPEVQFANFITRQKEEIDNIIKKIDVLFLDGFIAFNDVDRYIISCA